MVVVEVVNVEVVFMVSTTCRQWWCRLVLLIRLRRGWRVAIRTSYIYWSHSVVVVVDAGGGSGVILLLLLHLYS